jgi:hypothetical protein
VIGLVYSVINEYKGNKKHGFLLIWGFCILLVGFYFILKVKWDIVESSGMRGIILYFFIWIAILILIIFLISGIIYWDHKTIIEINDTGITIQDIYLNHIQSKKQRFESTELIKLYSNADVNFPYAFIVYERNKRKNVISFDKSRIENYDDFLSIIANITPVIRNGKLVNYFQVKQLELKHN